MATTASKRVSGEKPDVVARATAVASEFPGTGDGGSQRLGVQLLHLSSPSLNLGACDTVFPRGEVNPVRPLPGGPALMRNIEAACALQSAEGSGAVWTIQIQGRDARGRPFISSMKRWKTSCGVGTKAGLIRPL